jgi:flagellar biosynthesis protein FlhG
VSRPLSIAIGGGKGGVGKSVVAANLAVAMARLGFRVVLVDADLGAANLHTLFGIDRPGLTIQALIDRRIQSLEEAMVPTSVQRLFLVPGSGAIVGAANVAHAQKLKLIRHIQALDADVIVIDCGAGVSYNVIDFFGAADVRLLVATPQLTSLQNAYAFMKSSLYRSMSGIAEQHREREILRAATDASETERVRDLLERIIQEDFDLAMRIARAIDHYGAKIVGNQLEHEKERNVIHALSRMMGDFLSMDVPVVASLTHNRAVHQSVTKRRPFIVDHPSSVDGRELMRLAEELLALDAAAIRAEREGARISESDPPPPNLDRPLPGALGVYLRRHERVSVDWAVRVRVAGELADAQLVDISAGGASVRMRADLTVGDEVGVVAPGLDADHEVRAIVRNIDGDRLGLEFHVARETLSRIRERESLPRAKAC